MAYVDVVHLHQGCSKFGLIPNSLVEINFDVDQTLDANRTVPFSRTTMCSANPGRQQLPNLVVTTQEVVGNSRITFGVFQEVDVVLCILRCRLLFETKRGLVDSNIFRNVASILPRYYQGKPALVPSDDVFRDVHNNLHLLDVNKR